MRSLIFDIFARDKTAQAFSSVKNNVEGLNKGFDKIGKTLGAFKALLASAFALNYLKGAAEAAEHINDLSIRLGIGADVLSQYQLIASNTGVELDSIAGAMQKLAKNSVDAAEKGGEAADALAYLGINAQQFATLGIDDKFAVLATAIQGVEDPSKRVQIAMALMGKSGAEMLQVMAEGGEGLKAMQERADELGITLTNTQTGAIDSMMDAFGELGLAAKGVAQDFVALFAPAIELIANALTYVLVGAVNIVKIAFKGMIAIILDVVGRVANAFAWLTRQFSILPGEAGEAMKSISESLSNYGDILTSVTYKTDDATGSTSSYKDALDKTGAAVDNVNRKLAKTDPSKPFKAAKGAMDDAKGASDQAADGVADKWGEAASSMENDIAGAINGMSLDFNDLKGSALQALSAIGEAILKNIVNQQFGGGGGGGFGGMGGGGGGGFGDILGQVGDWFGGFFAEGGNFSGGKPIVVGERGPEMIMPRSSGTVIPNGQTSAAMRPINVNMNISTPDVASFRRSQSQIAASMAQAVQSGSRNL